LYGIQSWWLWGLERRKLTHNKMIWIILRKPKNLNNYQVSYFLDWNII
jgi:hypothetical protein